MYKKLNATSGAILEETLEWDGSFDEISNAISAHIPYFHTTSLENIEKEVILSAKEHRSMKKY